MPLFDFFLSYGHRGSQKAVRMLQGTPALLSEGPERGPKESAAHLRAGLASVPTFLTWDPFLKYKHTEEGRWKFFRLREAGIVFLES